MMFEQLESRQMLSAAPAAVAAYKIGSTLFVVGTSGPDAITVAQFADHTVAAFSGDEILPGGDADNEESPGTFSGINQVVVLAGAADDVVTVSTDDISVAVDLGAGNDVAGIDVTAGTATSAIDPSAAPVKVVVNGGNGSDRINANVFGRGQVTAFGGAGADVIGLATYRNPIDLPGATLSAVGYGGAGDDEGSLGGNGIVTFEGEAGDDRATLGGSTDGVLTFNGGAGSDRAQIDQGSAKNVFNGGAGNDFLYILPGALGTPEYDDDGNLVFAGGSVVANGGAGTDTLGTDGIPDSRISATSFERSASPYGY